MTDLLLADDDEGTRFLVKRVLARMGAQVHIHEAATGEEAIAILERFRVDVVLTDYNMGGPKNGVDVLCFAKERQPHARRVLMSGTIDAARMRAKAAQGCVHFAFEKPMKLEEWAPLLGSVQLDGA